MGGGVDHSPSRPRQAHLGDDHAVVEGGVGGNELCELLQLTDDALAVAAPAKHGGSTHVVRTGDLLCPDNLPIPVTVRPTVSQRVADTSELGVHASMQAHARRPVLQLARRSSPTYQGA